MDKKHIQECIAEFAGVNRNAGQNAGQNAGNNEASILEAALFVEDIFGFTLTDDEICEENLGNHQAIERFVIEKLGLK